MSRDCIGDKARYQDLCGVGVSEGGAGFGWLSCLERKASERGIWFQGQRRALWSSSRR